MQQYTTHPVNIACVEIVDFYSIITSCQTNIYYKNDTVI